MADWVTALSTVVLAIITYIYVRTARNTLEELRRQHAATVENWDNQVRASVMPRPFPYDNGNWLFPRNATTGPGTTVKLKNIGNGPALWLRWEVAAGPSSGTELAQAPLQALEHTFIMRLGTGPAWRSDGKESWQWEEVAELWHTLGSDRGGVEIPDRYQLTLWYDDILGNHYRCVFERHGDRWEETYRDRERERPPSRVLLI